MSVLPLRPLLPSARPAGSTPAAPPTASAGPGRGRQLANVVASQAAWFAAVAGAAHGRPALGACAALAAVAWHVSLSARPAAEAALAVAVTVLGALAETVTLALGHVAYPSGQWAAWLPPYWLVALWAVFATNLNVTLRWLRGRPALAVALGVVAGPAAFASGVRLGGARWVDPRAGLVVLALEWAVMLPLVVSLARRLDGVSPGTVGTGGAGPGAATAVTTSTEGRHG